MGAGSASSYAAASTHQLLGALSFLRTVSILHRDVKPENCLLKDAATLKLADFGVAIVCADGEHLTVPEGTPAYFPPEIFMLPRGKGYSYPADMWATGITVFIILHGTHPFMENGHLDKNQLKLGEFSAGWLTSASAASLLG